MTIRRQRVEVVEWPAKPELRTAADPTIIRIIPELAMQIGLNESIALLQIAFWIKTGGEFIDNKWWTYQSVRDMKKKGFSYWSIATINRTVVKLVKEGFVFEANYNEKKYDKTRWFALNLDKIKSLKGVTVTIGDDLYQNETGVSQNDTRSAQDDTRSAQDDTTIPETPSETPTEIDSKDSVPTELQTPPGTSSPDGGGVMMTSRIDVSASAGKTLVASFQDVKGHWNADTQAWDDERFVYVGRQNRPYHLKASPWRNPVALPKKATVEQRDKNIEDYRGYLWKSLTEHPDRIRDLLALDGKILVCWCSTDPALKPDAELCACHAHKLAAAVEYFKSHPEKIPIEVDYEALRDAVREVWQIYGQEEDYMSNMLIGRAKKGDWGKCNLPFDRRMDAARLRDWAAWHRQINPNISIVKQPVRVQSDILKWWTLGCPKANAAQTNVPQSERRFESHRMPTAEDYALTEEQAAQLARRKEQTNEPQTA